MKQFTLIGFVVLFLAIIVGIVAYLRVYKKGSMPASVTTNMQQGSPSVSMGAASGSVGAVSAVPSPLPTVSQIPLTIAAPANGSTVTSPNVLVKGTTTPKADVFVNDSETTADAQGNFSASVTLDEGDNTIVVTTNDINGNYSEQDVTVTYNSGQ